jgi:hypothetical protein
MAKKIILTLFIFVNSLFIHSVYSQIQLNVPDNLSQKFLSYCKVVPWEEIYVHCDREEYIAGEEMWFNIYLIDRQSLSPSRMSKIVYFEVLNSENRPVVQKRIGIADGFGPGQIVLPDTLSSGTYTLRAYTSWMKNFLPLNCYMEEISVYNAFNTRTFKRQSTDNVISTGGNIDLKQDTSTSGLTLKVNNLNPDFFEILIDASKDYCTMNKNLCYLFIQTHGRIDHVSTRMITEGVTKFSISKTLLTNGINQITIFDSKSKPVCERFIYTPGKESQFLSARCPDSCKRRSEVTLEIEAGKDGFTSMDTANISISVAPAADNKELTPINDYLVFGSEFGLLPWKILKGKKISGTPPEVIDSLLLNVKSNWINWGKILSVDPPAFKYKAERESHYLLGKLLTKDHQPADSVSFVLLSNPGKEASFQYATTDNDGNFSFNIHIDQSQKDLVIQMDKGAKNQTLKIETSFSEKYLQYASAPDSANNNMPGYISDWSANYQVRKIYGVSSIGKSVTPVLQPLQQKRFYGKPDIELVLADYIKLPVMQEVFFELLPGVILKSKKGVYEISIIDPVDNRSYVVDPGLLIDGVIINDPSIISKLDPETVERIDVVKEKYYVGNFLFYGIVNVITRAADFSCMALPSNAIRMPYRVIDTVGSFISPEYSAAEKRNSRIPDFRNTLFWNPSVKPDKDGKARLKFWTSDISSVYKVDIQGITSKGKVISCSKLIKVN